MRNPHEQEAAGLLPAGQLEVRHLRLVQAIALEGSVTRAAGRLHLSQSGVSHQLLDLERALSTRLFDRVGKRMVPTAAGARLQAAAERLLREIAAVERDLAALAGDARVELRVTTSCYTSYRWLPGALRHFTASHPRVDIAVVLEATRRAGEALAADEVDLAILAHPPQGDGWAHAELVTSELVVVGSPRDPRLARRALARGAVKWGDLREATILVHEISESMVEMLQGAVRDSWQRESGERLARPVEIRKMPLTEALVELARSGTGLGIVDRWVVEPSLGRDLVALPLLPSWSRAFHAVWRRGNPRGLPFEDLVEQIRAAGRACVAPAPVQTRRRRAARAAGR